MDEAMYIGFEAMPLDEDIKSGQGKGQPRLERRPGPMRDLLQMTDAMNHREYSLDQHSGIPQAPLTQFEIGRVTLSRVECRITQDDHLLFIRRNQGMKSGIGSIGASTIPADHQPQLIEQQTEFAADNPAMVRFPFAPDLPPTPAFAQGMQQFNAVAIDHAQERRGSQELVRPVPVAGQQAKQPRPLRQGRKQFAPIPVQPAIKCPIPDPFEGKENSPRDNFARPQVRQGMFGDVRHGFIYPIEQLTDKVFGGHAWSSFRCRGVAKHSLESAHDPFQGPLKLAPLVNRDTFLWDSTEDWWQQPFADARAWGRPEAAVQAAARRRALDLAHKLGSGA